MACFSNQASFSPPQLYIFAHFGLARSEAESGTAKWRQPLWASKPLFRNQWVTLRWLHPYFFTVHGHYTSYNTLNNKVKGSFSKLFKKRISAYISLSDFFNSPLLVEFKMQLWSDSDMDLWTRSKRWKWLKAIKIANCWCWFSVGSTVAYYNTFTLQELSKLLL